MPRTQRARRGEPKRIGLSLGMLVLAAVAFAATACDLVPRETVELSNTVGKDLEEVHRAHRALAELYFSRIEDDINQFIDNTYRPAFIRKFAEEFRLNDQITLILAQDPDKLLPVLTRFVETAVERTENKRHELLEPIEMQRQTVIEEIDTAHRQIQAAQAVVTGHLASVRKVREVQNELLAEVGLGDLRKKIADTTAEISDKVAGFVKKGEGIDGSAGNVITKVGELDAAIEELKTAILGVGQ